MLSGKIIGKEKKQKTPYFDSIRKRDGTIVLFDKSKISNAIFKAAVSVGGEDRIMAEELASAVTLFLRKEFGSNTPSIERIQDVVEKVLIETGHAKTAKAYILYREGRTQTRRALRVRKRILPKADTTDISLLVTPVAKDEIVPWDKSKITFALQKEAGLDAKLAAEIASAVETKIITSGHRQISTTLIRELVDNELFERGLSAKLKRQALIGMPTYDLDALILTKSNENSNISTNNPEAVNLAIAETTLKQYVLQRVFSEDIADAHMKGMIHIHDLGYPRVYCSSHSLEYIKKYGLKLGGLDTESAPAKYARTLTGHLNTFLASMQAYYAGALGVGYINIMYAPYLEGMSGGELKQEAQHLIFSGSQNAFSRGGQSLFIDHNVHTGIPNYLKKIPAIGPKGKYTGKTYGDYEKTAQRFARAMMDVWREGDKNGKVFAFPKCLDKDTKLFARVNGKFKVYTAEEIYHLMNTLHFLDVKIPNFNLQTKTVQWDRIKASARRGKEMGIAVSLPSNITFKTTADHPHIILAKNGLEVKEARQLCIGDVLLYKSPAVDISYKRDMVKIDVFDILKKRKVNCQVRRLKNNPDMNNHVRRKVRRQGWANIAEVDSKDLSGSSFLTTYKQKTHKLPVAFYLDENWGKLLGYFAAEGSYQQIASSIAQFCSKDDTTFFNDIKKILDNLDISYRLNRNKGKIIGLIFGGKLHKELLKGLMPGYSRDSSTKEVPWVIFGSPSPVKKAFLQGLFNGDGTTKHSTISLVTKSEKLAYGIQILLSDLGIFSTIYHEKVSKYPDNIYYNVAIKGKSNLFQTFLLLANKKFNKLPKWTYTGDNIDTSWYSHIPTTLTEKEDLPVGDGWKIKRHDYVCRSTLVRLPHPVILEHLIPMPVKKIEEVCVDAYAFEVDNAQHTFITGDGIFTHNCDLHHNEDTFKDPAQRELLKYAAQIASENGAPYFVFDRDEVTLSACCRLRTKIKDNYMIEHPESMRFTGFQNVTVNLPQAAYRAGKGNINRVLKEIDYCIDLAIKAHLQKKDFIARLMSEPGLPLWEIGRIAFDGRPYVDLNKATYIIGIVGLNECVQFLTGRQLHEDEDVFRLGLKIISSMYFKAKESEKKLGLKFSLEESPAESATRRLAKVDLRKFPEAETVVKGDIDNDAYYYTNSIHFAPDAPVDLITRIQKQAKFHTMIESGAIIHAFVGEKLPSAKSIMNLVEKTYYNTQAAQLTISPEFTICKTCNKVALGLKSACPGCGSENVYGITRIVGYFSRVSNWNRSKLGELADRRKYPENYRV